MWRNKEFKYLMITNSIIILTICTVLYTQNIKPIIILLVLAGMSGMSLAYLLATWYRSRKIKKYTIFLTRIQNGEYFLPELNNEEGELAILQHEVYKVTRRLIEQADMLNEKRNYLLDALSNISHQLKTPLTSLMMMADLLSNEKLPKERRIEFTGNMVHGLERMEWLIQALLKLSKLDSQTIIMKEEPIHVQELLKETLRELLIHLDKNGISITVDGKSDVVFQGDFAWCLEAVSNIIKNCMEHTHKGGTISIEYGTTYFYTYLIICDTGDGIDGEDLPHIFERFYRGKNSKSDSVGIGLALAKEIIIRHNGTISVESQKEEGTKFTIKLYSKGT